jgi:hypothetical protein
MISSRRWLIIFGSIIGATTVITLSLVLLTHNRNVTLLAADTPEGTLQRYLIALQDGDFQQAYSYFFANTPETISYSEWLAQNQALPAIQFNCQATLDKVVQNGNFATIDVSVTTSFPGGLAGGSQYSQTITFDLAKTGNSWLITSPTNTYWIY